MTAQDPGTEILLILFDYSIYRHCNIISYSVLFSPYGDVGKINVKAG